MSATTPVKLGYRPALDGVRGVAILSVVGMHFFGFPRGGLLGVDLFFVLSGFLITTLLLEEWGERGRVSLRAFYRRRALRLLPALVGMLAVYAAVVLCALATGIVDRGAVLAAFGFIASTLAYAQNFVTAFGVGNIQMSPLVHLWSLAEEEQFYVVWPIVLVFCLRRNVRTSRLLVVLAMAAVAVAVHRAALVHDPGVGLPRVEFGPDTRSPDALLVGCAFALVRQYGSWAIAARWRGAIGTAALALIVTVVLTGSIDGRVTYLYWIPLVALAGGALVFSLSVGPPVGIMRVLSMQPLVFVGTISYGLYVWHQLVRWLVPQPEIGFGLALTLAVISYRLIEQPFLRMKRSASDGVTPVLSVDANAERLPAVLAES